MTLDSRPRRFLFVLIAVAIAAAGLGIYGVRGPEGKNEGQATANGESGGLKPFATGGLAALLVKSPRTAVPAVAFLTGAGEARTLAGWKGKVVLVNLWATWCGPCRKEMPSLAALQKALGSADFEVVAVSVDRKGAEASSAFLKETGADGLNLYVEPEGHILNDLQAPGLPVSILIDRRGREAARLVGPADWSGPDAVALIKAALAEPTPAS